jgi:hypothetical protein
LGSKALTVLIRQASLGGDLDAARRDAMRMARKEGFTGQPESLEEIEDEDGGTMLAFFWERVED